LQLLLESAGLLLQGWERHQTGWQQAKDLPV
jgi:hypothetical protein